MENDLNLKKCINEICKTFYESDKCLEELEETFSNICTKHDLDINTIYSLITNAIRDYIIKENAKKAVPLTFAQLNRQIDRYPEYNMNPAMDIFAEDKYIIVMANVIPKILANIETNTLTVLEAYIIEDMLSINPNALTADFITPANILKLHRPAMQEAMENLRAEEWPEDPITQKYKLEYYSTKKSIKCTVNKREFCDCVNEICKTFYTSDKCYDDLKPTIKSICEFYDINFSERDIVDAISEYVIKENTKKGLSLTVAQLDKQISRLPKDSLFEDIKYRLILANLKTRLKAKSEISELSELEDRVLDGELEVDPYIGRIPTPARMALMSLMAKERAKEDLQQKCNSTIL